jgi:type IV pilus assembly protein PilA
MLQKLRERSQSEAGFTLVELLVVMLIIGLLAAIAIPSFFNQRDKANDASAKEDAHTAQVAMETYATDNNGGYTGATASGLAGIESALTNVNSDGRLAVTGTGGTGTPGADNYRITVTAKTTGNTFSVNRASSGALTYPCTGDGGCPSGGTWN